MGFGDLSWLCKRLCVSGKVMAPLWAPVSSSVGMNWSPGYLCALSWLKIKNQSWSHLRVPGLGLRGDFSDQAGGDLMNR